MVVRANRHPHPALTCLVRNVDYDQCMIGSCSGEHHGLVAMESQESEQNRLQGEEFRGRATLEVWGLRASGRGHREFNVRTPCTFLNGVCDVRMCLPLVMVV